MFTEFYIVRRINYNVVFVASERELDKLDGIIRLDFLHFVGYNYITASCIETTLTASQLHWTGHIIHMNDCRFPKAVFYGELAKGKRLHGGQWLRYKDIYSKCQTTPKGYTHRCSQLGDDSGYRPFTKERAILKKRYHKNTNMITISAMAFLMHLPHPYHLLCQLRERL